MHVLPETLRNSVFFFLLQFISIKDNDSLAAMLAAEVQADLLVLMSDVDGIYTCPPSQEGARLINTYTPDTGETVQFGAVSKVGTGGMDSKVIIAFLRVLIIILVRQQYACDS